MKMPYWDWTKNTGVPKLASFENWLNGSVKVTNHITTRNRDANDWFMDQDNIDGLIAGVQTAFCHDTFEDFDRDLESPHGTVHDIVGGQCGAMGAVWSAAYDPIFFLHHNFVDYQYAFWQELQKERNRNTRAHVDDLSMPPFNGCSNEGVGNPHNPIKKTLYHPTQRQGLDYQDNFGYKYDDLLFNGLTPREFHSQEDQLCRNRTQVGIIVKDYTKGSVNKIIVRGTDHEVGSFYVFQRIMNKPEKPYLVVDVTNKLDKLQISNDDKKIQFEVESYDLEGNRMEDNIFKPIVDIVGVDEERTNRIHTEHFVKYARKLRIPSLNTNLEFLKDDGSFASVGELRYSDSTERLSDNTPIMDDFPLMKGKNIFDYDGMTIDIGLDFSSFAKVISNTFIQ